MNKFIESKFTDVDCTDVVKSLYENALSKYYTAIYNEYNMKDIIDEKAAAKKLTAEMVNQMVNQYNNDVYKIEYVNSIIDQLDGPMQSFSLTKRFSLYSLSVEYIICINDLLAIRLKSADPYTIGCIYIKDREELSVHRMPLEAYEKISSKYMQYISRLEDTLGKTFTEILELGLST